MSLLRPFLAAATIALSLSAPALGQDRPLNVLATVAMISDVAQNVAGACADVQALIGPGTDPHEYSATPAGVRRLSQAELILYVDVALEERLAEVLSRFGDRVPAIGVVRAAVDPVDLLADPEGGGLIDPHLWMDVARWSQIAPVIAAAIAEARPDCAATLAANAADYVTALGVLHDWVGTAIASIPEDRRILVTAHDAFAYFSDAYGIEASEAILGISTAAEASIADIREVAAFVIERGVPGVFVETTVNPRTIEALVAEARAQGHAVEIGRALYSDAMGDPGTPEGTYIGMIRANTESIVTALGGTLPDWPAALDGLAGGPSEAQ